MALSRLEWFKRKKSIKKLWLEITAFNFKKIFDKQIIKQMLTWNGINVWQMVDVVACD